MMRSIIVLSLALLLVACKHEKEYSGNPIVEVGMPIQKGLSSMMNIGYILRCPIFLSELIAQIFPN